MNIEIKRPIFILFRLVVASYAATGIYFETGPWTSFGFVYVYFMIELIILWQKDAVSVFNLINLELKKQRNKRGCCQRSEKAGQAEQSKGDSQG